MCGRYVNVAADADLVAEFDTDETLDDAPGPSWNIAPTSAVRIVADEMPRHGAAPVRRLRTARWGLVPSWSRDASGAARMINARAETVTVRRAFRSAAARRRCLIPALGYYEWQRATAGRAKTAHFLHATDGGLLALAGLYELWRDPARPDDDPRWLRSCTIITRAAPDELGEIHDRCPVIVPRSLRAPWLDCTTGPTGDAADLLDAMPPPSLATRRVGPAVGNVRNNGPELIEPVLIEPVLIEPVLIEPAPAEPMLADSSP